MARIIHEVRPRFVFVENSPMLTSRGLGTVLGDLASMGFDARWGVLGAADVGAPHQRDRIWVKAKMDNTNGSHGEGNKCTIRVGTEYANTCRTSWWEVEPDVGRVADGVAARVDRLKAIGNGQVSEVARRAWEELGEAHPHT
jgi:DNA (cytosine-5)-methyltransferase 1